MLNGTFAKKKQQTETIAKYNIKIMSVTLHQIDCVAEGWDIQRSQPKNGDL